MGFDMGFPKWCVMKRQTKPVVHNGYFSFLFVKGMVNSKNKKNKPAIFFILCFARPLTSNCKDKNGRNSLQTSSLVLYRRKKKHTFVNDM